MLEPKAPDPPRSASAKQRAQQYEQILNDVGKAAVKRDSSGKSPAKTKIHPEMSFIDVAASQIFLNGSEDLSQASVKSLAAAKQQSVPGREPDVEATTSEQMETLKRLFDILSARSDIDHPVCSECTDMLLDGLRKKRANTLMERDAYVQFLRQAQESIPTDEERARTKRQLEETHNAETKLLQEVETLEAEKAKLEDKLAALDSEAEELDEEEERFWRERNAFTAELTAFQEERDSLQTRLAHDTKLLESLQRSNVYNDAFVIGHDGLFGTINGLRLGRLPDHPVDWMEINAAWGQLVLLLSVVSEKLGCKLKEHKLVAVGSTSKIVKYDQKQQASGDIKPKGTVLELYSSGNLSLGLTLFQGKFDEAMVAFLECLQHIGEHVERTSAAGSGSTSLKLPYAIQRDKIGGVSIRLGNFGQDEQWTKACKYTLTCCKFLLAHASHVEEPSDVR